MSRSIVDTNTMERPVLRLEDAGKSCGLGPRIKIVGKGYLLRRDVSNDRAIEQTDGSCLSRAYLLQRRHSHPRWIMLRTKIDLAKTLFQTFNKTSYLTIFCHHAFFGIGVLSNINALGCSLFI